MLIKEARLFEKSGFLDPHIRLTRETALSFPLPTVINDTEHDRGAKTRETAPASRCAVRPLLEALNDTFCEPFSVVNVHSGDLVHSDYDVLSCDLFSRLELLAEVARRGRPEIVEEVAPFSLLAIPLAVSPAASNLVAVGVFVNQAVETVAEMSAAAEALGVDAGHALSWARRREVWSPDALTRVAQLVVSKLAQSNQLERFRREVDDAVAHADDADVELELLHRLTRHLQISDNETELWRNALEWLAEAVPAQCLAIVPEPSDQEQPDGSDDEHEIMVVGECPTATDQLREIIRQCGANALRQPLLLNRAETALATWPCPTIRELVCVPMRAGGSPIAWLLALNHKGSADAGFDQFGSVEIRLLSSVSTMLGMHSSNIRLYQQQAELFASAVHALTSAIDAKDPYTSGHSDRVARVSVSLASQLGLDKETRDTIYLAGLLHDIGKIGIDDHVLNKPGELTTEEYEHIKLHPQLGYEILKGVEQLEKILPIVLHHHEAWDGGGYPHGLRGEKTPLMARIMAVADSFDAMSSDRPYRQGMSDERVDTILREGAGSQWDPAVVDAFFTIREEIRKVVESCAEESSPNGHCCVN